MVEFKPLAEKESNLIKQIVERSHSLGMAPDLTSLEMDLVAVYQNDCLLDFEKLLKADDFDFAHDVCGIQNHINRDNGRLQNHFLPKCAKPDNMPSLEDYKKQIGGMGT